MQSSVIVLIAILPLTALAFPVEVSAPSTDVTSTPAGQGEASPNYTEAISSSSPTPSVEVIANSGPSSLEPTSTSAESSGSGNTAVPSVLVDVSSTDTVDTVKKADSIATADLNQNSDVNLKSNVTVNNHGYFGNQFADANPNANVQDLESSKVQGSGAPSSTVQNHNQDTTENHENTFYYSESGSVIREPTTGNANEAEVPSNNKASWSTNVASALANLGLFKNQASWAFKDSGSSFGGQRQQVVNIRVRPLIASNAFSLPATFVGLSNAGIDPTAIYIITTSGIGGLYQNVVNEKSSSSSSSGSSHSDSHKTSSSSNLNDHLFHFGPWFTSFGK